MCTSSIRSVIYGFFLLGLSLHAVAQTATKPGAVTCGAPELTNSQKLILQRQATAALQQRRRTNAAFTGIIYVPIRPHIVRRTDGSGGFSVANLNEVMALNNRAYVLNGLGIQFYFCGTTPDFVDNDALYNQFPYPEGSAVDGRNSANALNQYYVNFIQTGVSGYAYYPTDSQNSTRSFIQTYGSDSPDYQVEYAGRYIIPHELGHNFGLYHTFGLSNGTGTTDELVTRGAGANCTVAGDLVCDTPADPYNIPGANFYYSDDCLQYDLSSTARDPNGEAYTPPTNNIMSYYNTCSYEFTAGQYDHIQAGLALRQSHSSYTLNCLPTPVVPPSNVVASINGSSVTVTWQDNASNEMGYFIERSTLPTSEFMPIAGVGPNTTTFTDTQFPTRTTYYYRIRPSNTTIGSLSPTAVVTLPAISGLTTTNVSGTSAQLNWNSLGTGITYVVQWRQVGAGNWNDLIGLTANTFTLQGLYVNTGYEWRVRASNSSDYSGPVTFSTSCGVPSNQTTTAVTRTQATFGWDSNQNHYQTYTLRWRPTGAANWSTITDVNYPYYTLNGLTPATSYEWEVQGVCSTSTVSEFSTAQSFATLGCQIPYATGTQSVGSTSVVFYWYDNQYDADKTYDLRYRPVGAANWQVKDGTNSSYVSVTGLARNTTYEWQVRSRCSPTEVTTYSDLKTFATTCATPGSSYNITTATTAYLSWYTEVNEPGTTYTLQYRMVGTPIWTTVSSLSATYYTINGLFPNITYEYQIRAICSANDQSNYSAVNTFATTCSAPYANSSFAYLVTTTSAQLNWSSGAADANTHYELQYRVAGSPNWITVIPSAITSYSSYTLTGLTNNTTYEWQVRTVCSLTERSAYVAGPNFTTQCTIPPYGYSSAQLTSVTLNWEKAGNDVQYDVQIRAAGSPNWITHGNIANTFFIVQQLTIGTTYEWQVRARCSDGITSDFSIVRTFQTVSCTSPINLFVNAVSTSAATIWWRFNYANADTRYEGRYRTVGATNWTTLSGLSSANGVGYYTITGLATNTAYEWQIQTICSPTDRSPFTTSSTFQTANCLDMYTVKTGSWQDPGIWSCNRIPVASDLVQIKHLVTIPAGSVVNARTVRYDAGQTLSFGTNASLKLGQ